MKHLTPAMVLLAALAVMHGALLVACSDKPGSTAGGGKATAAKGTGGGSQPASADSAPPVRTTSAPSDPCGWIPAEEVEAVVGKLGVHYRTSRATRGQAVKLAATAVPRLAS